MTELIIIGNMEGYEVINRVYSPEGLAPTLGASHGGGGNSKLILVEFKNERINTNRKNGQ